MRRFRQDFPMQFANEADLRNLGTPSATSRRQLVAPPTAHLYSKCGSAWSTVEVDSVLGAVIAVVGTLLGSVTTYAFQRRTADRAGTVAHNERLRQERLAAFTEFARSVTDLRRIAYDRWHRSREDRASQEYRTVHDEYYRIYTIARNAEIKIRLLTNDAALATLVDQAVERATEIKDAGSEQERAARGERAKQALDAFVSAAFDKLR